MDMMMPFLQALVSQSLTFGVWIAAAILAALRWRQHPQVSMLVLIGTVTMTLVTLASTYVSVTMPMRLHESGRTARELGLILAVWSLVWGVLRAGCWATLIVAIFGWRSSTSTSTSASARAAGAGSIVA